MHNHESHATTESTRGLVISLAITATLMLVEVVGGLLSHSLALVGDAGHMLVDALALGLSLFALRIARRPATAAHTFGYHRAEILAALANGVILVLVTVYVFYESYQRLIKPPEIDGPLMLIIAGIGLIGNVAGIFLLRGERNTNLNIRSAFLHVLGDAISSVGVIVAGLIVTLTGFTQADPIVAIFIGLIILVGAVPLVRTATDVLLESVPRNISRDKVIETIKSVKGVVDLHDIHIWSITSGIYALSSHIMLEDQQLSHTNEIIDAINHELEANYNITHTTLQLECSRCATCAEGFVCELSRPGQPIVTPHDEKEHAH